MRDATVARVLHVLGVVLWIGGVAFVTTVLLPSVRRVQAPEERVAFFERVERQFAWQARATTLLVGVSGFYIAWVWDLWGRFLSLHYWWMHAMVLIWAIFTVMLFIAEPLFLHDWFLRRAGKQPEKVFRLIQRLHWVLLTVSLIFVAGSHGL